MADALSGVSEHAGKLAVWGSPIAHSRSPQLHLAAYGALGLGWSFARRDVIADGFAEALNGLDESWRGLALTMPLKESAFRAAVERDRHAELTGAVNTLLLAREASGGLAPRGFNTDVGGIMRALTEAQLEAHRVRILGAGATAASALVAVAELGAHRVQVVARRPERAQPLATLGERLGVPVQIAAFDEVTGVADLTIATLPGGTELDDLRLLRLAGTGGPLFDVAYSPWPSSLARRWENTAVSGLGMLLHQAVVQIRIFMTGDRDAELSGEAAMLGAMREALTA